MLKLALLIAVAITCKADDVRLTGGPNRCEGVLEVRNGKSWNSVNTNKLGDEERRVVCRELHCGPPIDTQQFITVTSPKQCQDFPYECLPDAYTLKDCKPHQLESHDECNGEDVSLRCYSKDTCQQEPVDITSTRLTILAPHQLILGRCPKFCLDNKCCNGKVSNVNVVIRTGHGVEIVNIPSQQNCTMQSPYMNTW